ncbi:MAG: chloride channel protein [Aliidongia sp.]
MIEPFQRTAPLGLAGRLRRVIVRGFAELRGFAQGRLRDDEIGLVALAGLLGVGAGFGVVLLRRGVAAFHAVAFDIPLLGHLSDGYNLDWWRVLVMPCGGGLVLGALGWAIRRRRPREIVDAIEANALYGGRMSLTDSINLAVMTLLSGGFGASVGLEAAYTQLGAGYCSRMGIILKLRRDDLRTLVGCGAAAAIAAAFNAPLAGAFYAFELVIGRYSLSNLVPVAVAALTGTLTARATFGAEPSFVVERPVHISSPDYLLFVLLGLACAGLSIMVMRGVTMTEQWFRRRSVPNWLRPGIGGFAVAAIALVYPQILGSGHGGIVANLHLGFTLPYLIGLIAAKILASALSIGSGFRGGLFSAAIFIGSLFGSAGAQLADVALPTLGIDPLAYTLVGMASVAAGIIGAPVTMILLVLEGSGDFSATIGVLVGVLVTTVAVRHWFGYSFATWRFHLRGLKIRSPDDIAWLDEFRVGRLMRTDPKSVPVGMSVASLRKLFPIGSTKRVFAVDGKKLAGIVDLIELHGPDLAAAANDLTAGDLVHPARTLLVPTEDVRTALQKFADAQSETLPVVDSIESMEIIGYLTEAYALRRYNQELERRRAEQEGDSTLFSTAVRPDG